MEIRVRVKMNEKLFLKDPEDSQLGRRILQKTVVLIDEQGLESFTFKKLAQELGTAEASIYRYFENKHRLLIYLVAWYWSWQEFRVTYHTHNLTDPKAKLKTVIDLLVDIRENELDHDFIDAGRLHRIVMTEGSKTYLTKHVSEDNKSQFFKPYKDLCAHIGDIILEYNPQYKYPRSASSMLIEAAHIQDFFRKNLPALTDFPSTSDTRHIKDFLLDMLTKMIHKKGQ